MRRALRSRGFERAAIFAGLLALAGGPAQAEEEPNERRDAAEVVREGDVSQWLQHYQRERGESWTRQRQAAKPEPAETKPPPQEPIDPAARRDR